jgi:hypothetical protein
VGGHGVPVDVVVLVALVLVMTLALTLVLALIIGLVLATVQVALRGPVPVSVVVIGMDVVPAVVCAHVLLLVRMPIVTPGAACRDG